MSDTAIKPTRQENYPEWYQQVVKAADLAENSSTRGCMVIKPWGYGIWEMLQRKLDERIKATGHENAYFPLMIPVSFLEKEAAHVEGFAKECAVVTHHRSELKDGKMIPAGELEEPYVIRPTSETIIGESFSRWVQSYRDLPLLINQWANVVRWEMRPRLFLRTAEFLWQEGHTVHASAEEAKSETHKMIKEYQTFIEKELAMPVILGEKPESERFPGAEETWTVEAMMQDGKALQAGTSHYLGQNFAKASNTKFLDQVGSQEFAYTTSWGVSSRLIGGMIMTHADDNGMRVPPRVAPQHIVILPVIPNQDAAEKVKNYCDRIVASLTSVKYEDQQLRIKVDQRDLRGGEKSWQWIKRGIPLRIEAGPRDIDSESVVVFRRDAGVKDKQIVKLADLPALCVKLLAEIQDNLFNEARKNLDNRTNRDLKNFEEFKNFFSKDSYETQGFVVAPWSESLESEAKLAELKVTVRCLQPELELSSNICIITGLQASKMAVFAKAY